MASLCPRPPAPASCPRRGGPRRAPPRPGGLREPPPCLLCTSRGCLPGPASWRGGCAWDQPPTPASAPRRGREGGTGGSGSGVQETHDAHTGKDRGMPVSWRPETRPEVGGHPETCGPISLPAPTGEPLPPSPRDHFADSSGASPLGLTLPPEGLGSLPGLWTGAVQRGLRVEAEVGRPRLLRRTGSTHYAGLPPGDAWPFGARCPSRDVAGPQPSAFRGPPFQQQPQALGETMASGLRSRLWIPGRRHGGQPPEAWEACLPAGDGNLEGARCVRRVTFPLESTTPAPPLAGDAFSSRARPDHRSMPRARSVMESR